MASSNQATDVRPETIRYKAPSKFSSSATDVFEPIPAVAATATSDVAAAATAGSHDCPICLESLILSSSNTTPVVRLKSCQHEFHRACIQDCLSHHQSCPTCRKPVGEPQGTSPCGTMIIQAIPNHCPGFAADTTTIQITYSIPSGIQKSYHQHPGTHYHGTSRVAYLPNNVEGRHLLSRLKYAFSHGLTFAIGTSLTTHMPNCVVWSSIHHKTSLSGGSHSFPDPTYMDNTNESLDALNVPEATQLEPNKRQRQQATATAATRHSRRAAFAAAGAPPPPPPIAVVQVPTSVAAAVPVPPAAATTATATGSVSFVVSKETVPYNPPPAPPTAAAGLPPGYGTCPGGGTMSIEPIGSVVCPGFTSTTTLIQITYSVPSGIQQSYHDNPGLPFRGTSARVTYLPNNDDGRKLLKRMKFAWTRGWVFTVGTSLTSGKSNVVTWSTVIPHKTSLSGGGPFGFPDAHYLTLCNQSLDALQIPPFHACP